MNPVLEIYPWSDKSIWIFSMQIYFLFCFFVQIDLNLVSDYQADSFGVS